MNSLTHKELREHAARLLKDPGLEALFQYRLMALQQETMQLQEAQAVLETHREYNALLAFAEWLSEISGKTPTEE